MYRIRASSRDGIQYLLAETGIYLDTDLDERSGRCQHGEQEYSRDTTVSRHDCTEFEYERNWTSFRSETVLGVREIMSHRERKS